jgi:hypothetical protein
MVAQVFGTHVWHCRAHSIRLPAHMHAIDTDDAQQ